MLSLFVHRARCAWGIAVVVACGWAGLASWADEKLSEPIYKVASETAAQSNGTTQSPAPTAAPATPAAAPANGKAAKSVFDLAQKPGEHPLAPVVRTLKATMDEIDHNVHDYCCTLVKQERVDGELGEPQHILLKVMSDPFSVYMSFLKPYAGREVVYVAGQNQGKMVVLDVGVKRMLGKMNLDPQGSLAMSGQKHPITDVGIRNLTAKLAKMWEGEMKFAECAVTVNPDSHADGRSATMIQVVHPIPRQDFRFNYARLFLDNEKKVPIHFDAYTWPDQAGGEPQLDEKYTYTSLKLNNGYTAREFDATNNPDIFK
jgi:hypothetical protein